MYASPEGGDYAAQIASAAPLSTPGGPANPNLIAALLKALQGFTLPMHAGALGNGTVQGNPAMIDRGLRGNPWAQPAPGGNRGDGSTASGGFMWGNQLWQRGSGGQFEKWLAAHGVNAQTWAAMHPAAAKLIGLLAGRALGSAGPAGGV